MIHVKNSLGIWALGPNVTRFVPPGYHPQVATESMVERTKRASDGLHDLIDGLEYQHPGEVDEEGVDAIVQVLRGNGMSLPVIASGLHPDPTYALGSLINPDQHLRRRAIEANKK